MIGQNIAACALYTPVILKIELPMGIFAKLVSKFFPEKFSKQSTRTVSIYQTPFSTRAPRVLFKKVSIFHNFSSNNSERRYLTFFWDAKLPCLHYPYFFFTSGREKAFHATSFFPDHKLYMLLVFLINALFLNTKDLNYCVFFFYTSFCSSVIKVYSYLGNGREKNVA